MTAISFYRLLMLPNVALALHAAATFTALDLFYGFGVSAFLAPLSMITPLAFVAVFFTCCASRGCLTAAQVFLVLDIVVCLGFNIVDQVNVVGWRTAWPLAVSIDRWISFSLYTFFKLICVCHAVYAKTSLQVKNDSTQLRQPLISPPASPLVASSSSVPYYAGIAEPPSDAPIAVQPRFVSTKSDVYYPTINDSTSYVPTTFHHNSNNNIIAPPSSSGVLSAATSRAVRDVGWLLLAVVLASNAISLLEYFLLYRGQWYVLVATPASLFTLLGALVLISRRNLGIARVLFAVDIVCGMARVITITALQAKQQQYRHNYAGYIVAETLQPLSFLLFVVALQITAIRVANRGHKELA